MQTRSGVDTISVINLVLNLSAGFDIRTGIFHIIFTGNSITFKGIKHQAKDICNDKRNEIVNLSQGYFRQEKLQLILN